MKAAGHSTFGAEGLRCLYNQARCNGNNVVWGHGPKELRFIVRQFGDDSEEPISGWATGRIGLKLATFRRILGDTLDEKFARLLPEGSALKEPTFDAAVLPNNPAAASAMRELLIALTQR